MKTISLTEKANGSRIEVSTGATIQISLPENPTTGFRWAIDRQDEGILTAATPEYFLNEGPGIGGGGVRRFTFNSVGTGEAVVALKNWRDWEGEGTVIDRFQVTIVVK
jgi:inhibitor of cysteine peptidase